MIRVSSTRRLGAALIVGALIVGGCALLCGWPAYAQTPAQTPVASHPADALKAAFDALPDADRHAIQDALVWTGDYKGTIDGVLGRGGIAALAAYAKRARITPEAVLGDARRNQLVSAARKLRAGARFAVVRDPRSGASVALPAAVFTRRSETRSGSRWSNSAGSANFETFHEPDGDLPALYERLRAPAPGRRVTYNILRQNFLVVSGEDRRGLFYIRAARDPSSDSPLVRGYTLVYARALQPSFDTFSIAISNGFQPFPAGATPAQTIAAEPRGASKPQRPRRVIEATALALAPNRALTALARDCPDMRIAGRPAKTLRRDTATGLALLEAQGLRATLASPAARPPSETDIFALFAAQANQGARVALASGRMLAPAGSGDAWRVSAAVQDGIGGAAVFDRSGAWMGMIAQPPQEPRRIAGVIPQRPWPTIPAEAALAFLASSGVKIETGVITTAVKTASEIASANAGALVAVSCQR